ncbi:hypothetical protein N0V82_005186 [Gnomoniopsis sp. IMI 355080]|nr:hypothetical protein N0V82_005186 [Gnomoniopsis sp. IMI 355080]
MVLTTPELLEPILLGLDMRSLLTSALRVCRQWRDVIQASRSLQRALFFECDEKQQLPAEGQHDEEVTFNPLLVEMFPLLFDFAGAPSPHGFNDLAIEALPIGRHRVAFYRLSASWRRMHIRHPPVKQVGLWTLDVSRGRTEKLKMVKYDGGLRMECFYFLVLKHVYWWDLFVKWGETQGHQLPHFTHVRQHMVDKAEEIVRTADVTIGAWGEGFADDGEEGKTRQLKRVMSNEHSVMEEHTGNSADDNGLLKMGIFWFKVKEPNHGKLVWERRDDEAAADVIALLRGAEKNDRRLKSKLNEIVGIESGSWALSVAKAIFSKLVELLLTNDTGKMGNAINDALQKVDEVARAIYDFLRDHPLAVEVFCMILAIGILWFMLPWVLEVLGFAAEGPVAGE